MTNFQMYFVDRITPSPKTHFKMKFQKCIKQKKIIHIVRKAQPLLI